MLNEEHPSSAGRKRTSAWELVRPLAVVIGSLTLALVVAIWVAYYAGLGRMMFSRLQMNDFGRFYYSARAARAHGDMYSATPATARDMGHGVTVEFWNMNPPHFHLLLLPLARMSPLAALTTWWSASLLATLASALLIFRTARLRVSADSVLWAAAALLFCSVTGAIIVTGQLTFLLLLPVTLAWSNAVAGRWSRAALYLGVAASVKPFLGLFLVYLVLRHQFRAAGLMAAAASLCFAIGIAAFGLAAHIQWLHALSSVSWPWAVMNGSLAGLFSRSLAANPFFTPLVQAPGWIQPLTILGSLLVLAVSIWALTRRATSAHHVFAGAILTAQLVSPLGWIYYLWLVAPPLVGLLPSFMRRRILSRDILLAAAIPGLVCPYPLAAWWRTAWWSSPTIGSIYTWTTGFLWAAVMVDCVRAASPAAQQSADPERLQFAAGPK